MKNEHRSIVAIALSVGVLLLWYLFFNPQSKPATQAAGEGPTQQAPAADAQAMPVQQQPAPAADEGVAASPGVRDPHADIAETLTTIETPRLVAVFSNKGGVPVSWELKDYYTTTAANSPQINLAPSADTGLMTTALSFVDAGFSFPDAPTYRVVGATERSVSYAWRSDEVEIIKTYTISEDAYTADVDVTVRNLTRRALAATPVLAVSAASLPVEKKGFFGFMKPPSSTGSVPLYYLNGKVHREPKTAKLPAMQVIAADPQASGGMYWAGLEDRYFLSAAIPRELSSDVRAVLGAKPLAGGPQGALALKAGAALAPANIPAGAAVAMKYSTYMGPKEIVELKAVGVHLEDAIDYGWFTIIAKPILYMLKFFYAIVRNYGVAIILLTIVIKLMLHPINLKSLKSMKAMQDLQPRLKELQKKHKGDKERLNVETMSLFRAHKVNPVGGCLPMLLQFPIYIALYKVLWNSIELYHAPFVWFYRDLSAPDPYYITPILLGIFMVAQQKLMPSATADPAQQKMMMIMPIMFTAFMVFLPVGLVIYILVNTVMTVATQWMYNKGIRMRDVVRFRFKTTATVS